MEIAFPRSKYIEAVEKLFEIAESIAVDGEQFLTCPISLRFVKSSEQYMAMQYTGDPAESYVCMIEFPILNGTIGGFEILARIEKEMYKFEGKPHWGQLNHVGVGGDTLNKLYPKFPLWLTVYKRFCPNGTFQNDFTERCRIVS